MKRSIRICVLVCVMLAAVFALTACDGKADGQTIVLGEGLKADGISVSATGEVSMKPDMATVSLGVFTQKATAKQAQQENAQIMTKVMSAVTGAGIRQEDIKTVQYSVYPAYSYTETRVANYDVTNVIQFETGDVNKVGEVLDAAANAGANTSFSVTFGLKDDAKAYQQALELAVKNAQAKAEKIASAAGRGVGAARSINETKTSDVIYESYAAADKSTSSQIPVSAGTLKVQATVDIVYDWK
ncbi:MAG: SIMPL domain-containing protein [Bacillota bacterium]